jgi:nicotinic acid mononucleotide adenylyltransferase
MKNYKQLIKELPSKSVVLAFGRFNPPTIGHELLFKVVKKLASSHNADYVIYASRTQDKKKNPLPVNRKIHYLNLMFPNTNFVAANDEIRTFMEAAKLLNTKYKNIIMVAGSDRVQEYTRLLNNYNGKEYKFDTIQVISAGERDPDSDEASGMSASKMRAAALKGDYLTFKKGLPTSIREIDGKLLMNELRQGMGLESIKENIKFSVDELREKYFSGEIYHIGEVVESAGIHYEIMDRGSNYLTLIDESGKLCKKWINDVAIVEEKKGLWANIHAKRKRIKNGSNERMRKPGSEGAPTDQALKDAQVKEDIQGGYAPAEITFKGYTTKNLHHSGNATKAFQSTIERYGNHDPVAVLNALKATDTYMQLNDMHLEQGKAPDDDELNAWKDAHARAKDSLDRIGEFPHHMDYWRNHADELMRMEGDYNPTSTGSEMADSYKSEGNMVEELTTKTIKLTDKLKVARIIASFLGVESPESLSNPEQIVNMGLRKAKSKILHADSIAMLRKMLSLADEVEIKYDSKLISNTVKESVDSRVTVNTKSNFNAAKDILRYKDFKKLLKMNKGEIPETAVQDDDDMDPYDYDDKVAGAPDDRVPDDGVAPPATEIASKDLENQGPRSSEVGSSYGHGNNSHLRRRMARYATESVEIDEDIATADYKVNHYTGRKYRAHRVTFANSKMGGKPDDTPDENEDESDYKRNNKKMAEAKEKIIKKVPSPFIKKDVLGGGAKSQAYDAFFQEEEIDDEMDEKDLDQMANSIDSVEDVIDAYDDHELAIVDEDDGEELESDLKEEALNEVLSRMERIRAKARFARTKSKRQRKTMIALKKHSNAATLNARARKLAVKLIKTRIARKDPSKMSIGEKERAEKFLSTRKALINRLAMKLVSKVRKIENDRLSHHKYTKK